MIIVFCVTLNKCRKKRYIKRLGIAFVFEERKEKSVAIDHSFHLIKKENHH